MHGSGPPLVCTAWLVSHIQEDWEGPGFRSFFGALVEHHTIIRYDRPGSGLSDRERDNVDLASEVAVLGGLIEYLELGKTSLLGISCAGPPSLVYAATHPDRVDRLVFFGSYVDGSHVGNAAVRDALQALVRAHWGMGASALADLFAPDLEAPERKRLGRAQRRAPTADMSARLLALTFDAEVRALAAGVQCPALVLHRRQALEQEREALSVELRTAVGLGGRSRQHKDHSERARKAVSARLRAILKKIRAVHPELGEHLESSITTGIYCCYAPTDGTPWAVR